MYKYLVLLSLFLSTAVLAPVRAITAFPGAEGFGANTVGGRGGTVYEVTNTNDSGTGSLRACVAASGPRTCVFKVGGLITLNSPLEITNPFITIAGQTAPGGGITLKRSAGGDIFWPKTHDIIIRYVTGRPGSGGENHATQVAQIKSASVYNIIFDHCSFSWAVDTTWETWYRTFDTTIQWSFVTEALDCSTHSKGCHSKGLMIGGYSNGGSEKGSYNISVHHNLMAHNADRNPLIQMCGIGQVINNITYNPYYSFSHQFDNCIDTTVDNTVNWIGNFHKKGPDSTSGEDLKVRMNESGVARLYVKGNIGPSRPNDTLPEINWVVSDSRSYVVSSPAPAPAVTTTDAVSAYDQVLAAGGNSKAISCNGTWVDRRDTIDVRVVNDVKNTTGKIIDDESEVGGWITPATGTGCVDTDKDGMSDIWEEAHGLNKTTADNNGDIDGNGYTNLEDYLNGNSSVISPSPSPTLKPGDANGNGVVDGVDYVVWLNHYNQTMGGGPSIGDFNSSGKVDGVDYVVWLNNYGK